MMPTIIFIHIPKAAGRTLHNIIERNYAQNDIYSIHGSTRRLDSIEQFKNMSEDERRQYRVIKGHLFYGHHVFVPEESTYITVFREPVDRIISHYYHVLRHSGHFLHQEIIHRRMSLKDYASSGLAHDLDNGQTRMISGDEGRAIGSCDQLMLEKAKQHLEEKFTVAGLQERFEDTLQLLKACLGWQITDYSSAHVNENRPKRNDIPHSTIDTIIKHNQLDMELYAFVKKSFERQIEAMALGSQR